MPPPSTFFSRPPLLGGLGLSATVMYQTYTVEMYRHEGKKRVDMGKKKIELSDKETANYGAFRAALTKKLGFAPKKVK